MNWVIKNRASTPRHKSLLAGKKWGARWKWEKTLVFFATFLRLSVHPKNNWWREETVISLLQQLQSVHEYILQPRNRSLLFIFLPWLSTQPLHLLGLMEQRIHLSLMKWKLHLSGTECLSLRTLSIMKPATSWYFDSHPPSSVLLCVIHQISRMGELTEELMSSDTPPTIFSTKDQSHAKDEYFFESAGIPILDRE